MIGQSPVGHVANVPHKKCSLHSAGLRELGFPQPTARDRRRLFTCAEAPPPNSRFRPSRSLSPDSTRQPRHWLPPPHAPDSVQVLPRRSCLPACSPAGASPPRPASPSPAVPSWVFSSSF